MPGFMFNGLRTSQPFERQKKELKYIHKQELKQFHKKSKVKAEPEPTLKPNFETRGVFDFQKLPAEIRNIIYRLTFVKPGCIGSLHTLDAPSSKCSTHGGPFRDICVCFYHEAISWRNLNFAITCRQIYQESSYMFFAQNGFAFYETRDALHFLMAIGPRCRAMITKLRFHGGWHSFQRVWNDEGIFDFCRYLKSCTNLRHLHVCLYAHQLHVQVIDPIPFFLGKSTRLQVGKPQELVSETDLTKDGPMWNRKSCHFTETRQAFVESLLLVKREELGEYKPFCGPNVFTDDIYLRPDGHFLKPPPTTSSKFSDMSDWVKRKAK